MNWNSYIGQGQLKERLQVHIQSTIVRQGVMDHVLLAGPPGYGKTTIARLIGEELGVMYRETICPYNDNWIKKVVAGYNGVMLLDEIHRLSTRQQEDLLPLIQDGYIQSKGSGRIESNWLCIIGATTEPDQIITPLWDRFPIKPKFDEYTDDEMTIIVKHKLQAMGMTVSDEVSARLSVATGGVPRLANDIAVMARDLKTDDVDKILSMLRITDDGLSADHVAYIQAIASCGGVAGLSTISTHLRLPGGVIMELERLLIRKGYIEYTRQGRSLTGKAYQQFQLPF